MSTRKLGNPAVVGLAGFGLTTLLLQLQISHSLALCTNIGASLPNDELLEQTIAKFIRIGLFKQEDLIIKDIRSEKYANVVFDHHIYENRQNLV